jgi:hypothetical protein
MEVVQRSIPNIGACMKLITGECISVSATPTTTTFRDTRLCIVIRVFIKYYSVGAINELKPFPFLFLLWRLKRYICGTTATWTSPGWWPIMISTGILRFCLLLWLCASLPTIVAYIY